ncbi:MAG: ribonuclease domain-containing protein [Eubacteriales bacterium]|nr:ribonuclease domain-containing protein [Eubacteriales bacterium]
MKKLQKLSALWLALLLAFASLTGCASDLGVIGDADGPTAVIVAGSGDSAAPDDTTPPDSGASDAASAPGSAPDAVASAPNGDPTALPTAGETDGATQQTLSPAITHTETVRLGDTVLDEEGWYTDKDTVALYLMEYGQLPGNYITKAEARALGWEGGSLEPFAPGRSIGGDRFGNYEGSLPEQAGRSYTECDIDTAGASSRGAKRLVFSNDGLIFYTADHYETFTMIVGG